MAVGLDPGTMYLVMARHDELVDQPVFSKERNAFLQLNANEDTEDILADNDWSYIKHAGKYYVLSDLALKVKNMLTIRATSDSAKEIITTNVGELRRPMQNGVLNTANEKLSVAIIQKLIANLLGKPQSPNECLCFCSPSAAVNSNVNVGFHRDVLQNFLSGLGYKVESIAEALAIIFSERPVAEDPAEKSGESAFTGIGISYGAGMANVVLALKKMPLISFSMCESGDWIDQQAAQIAGCDPSIVTSYKEATDKKTGQQKFDLRKINQDETIETGLNYAYRELIRRTLTEFSAKFQQLEKKIEFPLEIVIAGGTASVPGFIDIFNEVLQQQELPFEVKGVRLSDIPLYTVANGCLAKALNTESKQQTPQPKTRRGAAEPKEEAV